MQVQSVRTHPPTVPPVDAMSATARGDGTPTPFVYKLTRDDWTNSRRWAAVAAPYGIARVEWDVRNRKFDDPHGTPLLCVFTIESDGCPYTIEAPRSAQATHWTVLLTPPGTGDLDELGVYPTLAAALNRVRPCLLNPV